MKTLYFLIVPALVLYFQGCSHEAAAQKKMDQEIAAEPAPKSQTALYEDITTTIQNSPTLSGDEKQHLLDLGDQTLKKDQAMDDTFLKLKAELFEDILGKDYDKKEMKLVHQKMKDVAHQKVELMFDTLKAANKIMGRKVASNHNILKHMGQLFQNRRR